MKEDDYILVQGLTQMRIAYGALKEAACHNDELQPLLAPLQKQIDKAYAKLETTE